MGETTPGIEKENQKMSKDKADELMGIVDGFIQSIREYDGHFNMKCDRDHECVMASYRDSAFGILLSLFTLNLIPNGTFYRKLHQLNCALYKKIG